MALIDVLIKEIKESGPTETENMIGAWVERCRAEGLSVYTLEVLLKIKEYTPQPRSMARFTSSPYHTEVGHSEDTPSHRIVSKQQSGIRKLFNKIFNR